MPISASPNPVEFGLLAGPIGPRTTRITWNADPNTRGRVCVSVDGGTEGPFDGDAQNGRASGTKEYTGIQLGHTYEFRLKQTNTAQTLLASVKVTTKKKAALPGAVVDTVQKAVQGVQDIHNLTVAPAVDSVTFTFRTRQPCSPWIFITDPADTFVDGSPGNTAKSTVHRMVFEGFFGSPLAQDTEFRYRIVADALPGSMGPSKYATTGRFRTGSRTADITLEKIFVRNDGDPGWKGAGEFTFRFGAGDAATGNSLGNEVEQLGELDVSAGADVRFKRQIHIPHAPRGLWLTVVGNEDDSEFYPGARLVFFGEASFDTPGSKGFEDQDHATATVTEHFVIGDILDGTKEIPIVMPTGSFAIAFTVLGKLEVEARRGEWRGFDAAGPLRPRAWSQISVVGSSRPGDHAKRVVLQGKGHKVVVDSDGAVYQQALGGDRSLPGPWRCLGGRFIGPVTAVALPGARVAVFGLGDDGTVLYRTDGADPPKDADWHSLGGTFVGSIAAASQGDGVVELFTTDADGTVFHGSFDAAAAEHRGDWQPFGIGARGALAALTSPRDGLSLFALGADGAVFYKRREPGGEWRPGGREWASLGVASDGLLSAEPWAKGKGLLMAVVAADETVRVLPWPDYPEGTANEGWQVVGTVTSLLQGRVAGD
jgi:hypothetical protein